MAKRSALVRLFTSFILSWALALASPAVFASAKPADVRVLIDVSGSMKQNDPGNLRRPAVDLLVKLLPEDAKAGIWTFGETVNVMVPHKTLSEAWRKDASRKAGSIGSTALYTNIGAALDKASTDFSKLDQDYRTSIILLTDGMVDISKDAGKSAKSRQRILDEYLPKARKAGVAIHTIALSNNADKRLLEQLALETDGFAGVANNADELMKLFLKALDASAPSEQVPLKENRFLVDGSIEEFTALVFKQDENAQTSLIDPDKEAFAADTKADSVSWFVGPNYDLVTVKKPKPGQWQIKGDVDPDNRVTIVSNLDLEVNELPKNLFPGAIPDLVGVLKEDGKAVTQADFLKVIEVGVVVTDVDQDKRWRKSLSQENPAPEDGRFTARLSMLQKAGHYETQIVVDGKTFQRASRQLITVRDAFAVDVDEEADHGSSAIKIKLYARDGSIDRASVKAQVTVKNPAGESQTAPLVMDESQDWAVLYPGLSAPGAYGALVSVSGRRQDGSEFVLELPEQTLHYQSLSGEDAAQPSHQAEPQPVVETKAEPVHSEEPHPAPEPATKTEALEEVKDHEPVSEEKASGIPDWLLYTGLAVGNLLIAGLAFLAYRMVKGTDKSKVLDDGEEDTAEIDLNAKPDPKNAELEDMLLAGTDPEPAPRTTAGSTVADDVLGDFADEIIEIAPDKNE